MPRIKTRGLVQYLIKCHDYGSHGDCQTQQPIRTSAVSIGSRAMICNHDVIRHKNPSEPLKVRIEDHGEPCEDAIPSQLTKEDAKITNH